MVPTTHSTKPRFSTERLRRLFQPQSIVVIGGNWATRVIEECQKSAYGGRLYAIHDERDQMAGVKCYRQVSDLPEAPDACYIAIKHEKTIEIIKQLNAVGAGGAVVFASGFAELGPKGAERQEKLLAACHNDQLGHMPFVGPNCYGIINMNVGSVMWPDFHGLTRVHNGVAIITQSGNIAINLTMQKRGLPISYIMTMGNQAMVGISDVMQVMADDPHVKAIGLHIEGFGDINHFIAAVRYCHSRGKPVSVLKTGLSTKGAELTMSHTASLAGSGASAGAFLQRLGVPQMHDVPDFLEMLKLQMAFGLTPLPALPQRQPNSINLISFSCSGGEATLMADLAESLNKDSATDIIFPPLSQPARDKLFALHGDKVSLNNPFDYQTYIWGNEQQLRDNFAFALETPVDYGLLVLDIPNRPDMDSWAWRQTHEGFMAGITANHRRGIIVASMVENLPDEKTCHAMLAAGIAPLAGFASTLRLLQQSAAWSLPATNSDDYHPIGLATATSNHAQQKMLSTNDARALLTSFGLTFPRTATVDRNNFLAIATAFPKPLVLKAEGLAHKTEANGVRLNLSTMADIEKNAAELFAISDQITLEEMILDKKLELLLGLNRDPVHGLMLVIGEGGILTELRADRVLIPLPTTAAAVRTALLRLRIAPLLGGFRGQPPLAIDAVINAAMAVNNLAVAHQHSISTLDINPLLVGETRAIAVDQLLVFA